MIMRVCLLLHLSLIYTVEFRINNETLFEMRVCDGAHKGTLCVLGELMSEFSIRHILPVSRDSTSNNWQRHITHYMYVCMWVSTFPLCFWNMERFIFMIITQFVYYHRKHNLWWENCWFGTGGDGWDMDDERSTSVK